MYSLKKLAAAFAVVAVGAVSTSAYALTQLGFALDESGSIGPSAYNIEKAGLAAALGSLPTDGSIEITVVSYSNNVQTLVMPTVLTAASLPGIQASINGDGFSSGLTNTAGAINELTSLMTASSNFVPGDASLINISTDGSPNVGSPNGQAAAVAAGAAAAAAGIDSISFEVIGGNTTTVNNAAAIAFPGPVTVLPTNSVAIPNPINGSFVVPVSNIQAYAPVILAKVQSVAQVPVSGSLSLLGLGLVALGAARVRRSRAA